VRKLTLSLAVMAALLPVHGYSLGLGELELSSALNQELNAEIEVLSATSSDAEQILIKLADRDAFIRAGLDRPFLLQQLKFKMIEKNGKPYVKVYTKTPVREPFLSFLLEIDWPQGHLLREYTLLLDPPVYNTGNTTTTAPANTSGSFNEPADTQAQNQPVYSEQQSTQSVQSSAQTAPVAQAGVISSDTGRSVNYQYQALPVASSSSDQYRVQQNDTLWSVASRMRPDSSISVEQMMLALVKRNPEAFIQENINGIKRGYVLRIPKRDEITQLDRQQAVAQAREHAALWREYSQGVASSSPASSMEADTMEGSTAADQPRDADGHLSIKGASDTGSEFAGTNQDPDARLNELKQDLAMAREQLESERLEKEDLRSRLAELEQRVQRVIEMDDSELAKLQQDLQSSQTAAAPVEEAMPEEVVTEESAVETMPDEQVSEEVIAQEIPEESMPEEGMPEEGMLEEVVPEEDMEEPVDELAETAPGEEAIFVDEATTDTMTDEMAEEQGQVTESVEPVEAIDAPAFVQTKPKGFLESLMDDPKLLGMIGGGLAFVLLLVALLLKRIRGSKAEEEEQWTSAMDDSSSDMLDLGGDLDLGMDEATVKTEAVDMNTTAEMLTEPQDDDITRVKMPATDDDLKDTVFSLNDEEPVPEEGGGDDVIAETDVYLAYGIYQQAEELLNNAINQNPERDDYRMKLLETHFASKNAGGFEQLAQDVKSRKGDDKSYWDRVVAMGMELCPGSPLFSGGDAELADFDPDALLPDKLQTTDLELDAGAGEETDFDLGLDDVAEDVGETQVLTEPLDLGEMESLDDDLDLAGDLEDIASDISDEPVEEEPLEEDTSAELEFDLGEFDDMEDVEGVSLEAEDVNLDSVSDESADMDIDDDFSLDFDAADLGFEESEDDEAEEISLDADLDLGVDLDESTDESVEIGLDDDLGGDLDADLGDIEIDGDELDLGDMDVGDMDLGTDLDDTAGFAEEDMDVSLDVSGGVSDDDEFDISELSEEVDEVSTKLDLAKAYIDMGDNDGARSILEEVKAEGNDEQQQQAEELLQKAS